MQKYEEENEKPNFFRISFVIRKSYMVTYGNGTLAIATWSWEASNSNILQYSWDYGNMNSAAFSGKCEIQFSGSQCILTEDKEINGIASKMTYTLSEAM